MTGDLATRRPHEAGVNVKPEIHPTYGPTTVTCSCGNTFVTRSTAADGEIHTDVCSACHPFYTGKQKILDTGGRVARFERRFGKKAAGTDKSK
jgi:large subunit ribosomal protein L31